MKVKNKKRGDANKKG